MDTMNFVYKVSSDAGHTYFRTNVGDKMKVHIMLEDMLEEYLNEERKYSPVFGIVFANNVSIESVDGYCQC